MIFLVAKCRCGEERPDNNYNRIFNGRKFDKVSQNDATINVRGRPNARLHFYFLFEPSIKFFQARTFLSDLTLEILRILGGMGWKKICPLNIFDYHPLESFLEP